MEKAKKDLDHVDAILKDLEERIEHTQNVLDEANGMMETLTLTKRLLTDSRKGIKLKAEGHWKGL